MTSIRRTLILNVTVLLVLALGTMAALAYRNGQAAVEDKHRTASELINVKFESQVEEAMLAQARLLASEAERLLDPAKFHTYYNLTAGLSIYLPAGPNSHITAPLWLAQRIPEKFERPPTSLSFKLSMHWATEVRLTESEEMTDGYVQVHSDWGNVWQSKALAGHALPLDISQFKAGDRFQWAPGYVEVAPGKSVKCVRMKAPLQRFRVLTQPLEVSPERASLGIAAGLKQRDPLRPERLPGGAWFDGRGPRGRPPMRGTQNAYAPTIYIQVAWDSVHCPARFHELENDRDEQLKEQHEILQQATVRLKERLIWVGGGALAIVVIGGWLLVGAGLAPLKRLSEAVSQVSARDFKLPIEPRELPREIRPVAERLTQTLEQLQAAFAREKRSSADISHELRTPLAALTTTLEVALRKPRSSEDYRQTIEDSRHIARQMSALVERMLMLAWLDAGADQLRSQAVDVDQLVDGCAAIGKPLAEAQGLRFRVNSDRPLKVQTDPDKLREVVMNLLHNAIEYNRPGGEVEILARAATTGGGIVVEVRDTGVGIPVELHEKIFERFYRGDPSRNAAGVHAGLGLAIVKEYVDRLGGRLSIESTVGTGSRFCLELPNV